VQLAAQLGAVVAAVGPELPRRATAGAQLVDERQQVQTLVLVAGADADRERRPGSVDR
jgi:hypothetical protein